MHFKAGLTQTFYDSNEDAAYERIGDCLYEQIDDKPVQEQQENISVVGGSVDDIAITSPAYETTTSFTATGMVIHLSCSYIYNTQTHFLLYTSPRIHCSPRIR